MAQNSYYLDSLFNAYFNESKDALNIDTKTFQPSVPEIAIQETKSDQNVSNKWKKLDFQNLYQSLSQSSQSNHLASPTKQAQSPTPLSQTPLHSPTYLEFRKPPRFPNSSPELTRSTRGNLRSSIKSGVSLATLYNSLYSPVSDTTDLDLESLKIHLDESTERESRLAKFKKLLKKDKQPEELSEEQKFLDVVCKKLQNQYYHYEKTETLNVSWSEAAEIFYFGETLDKIFGSKQKILSYVLNSQLELGEPVFSNLSRYHDTENNHPEEFLRKLSPNLARFNDVLDLYAERESNISLPQLFEVFSSFANEADGLCIPLATSMFGRWLLAYNRDSGVESNYQNTLILNFFRKGARMALALEKCKDLLNVDGFDKAEKLNLQRYLNKDNSNALLIALQSLGEYFQFQKDHNLSVTLWELNCHLTKDTESGNLAILGLTDGYGFGNHIKQHNKLGKKLKTNKFNTKRRIAHLYRILMSQPGFDEYGVSWANKEKYD